MEKEIRIRRGLNIKLKGQAEKVFSRVGVAGDYALYPTDFPMMVPRLLVREGDSVKAGTPIFCDKKREQILFASPVHGTVKQVLRGERRRIEKIVISCPDESIQYEEREVVKPAALDADTIIAKMLAGGVWPLLRQRPFNVIPNPEVRPRAIFISAFETAPLAPDMDFALKSDGASFQAGLDVLSKLADDGVHLGLNAKFRPNPAFADAKGVKLHRFNGPHPAGNVGVQIHHVAPVAKGEVVWTVNPLDVVIIGRLFQTGHYDAQRIIAVAGSMVEKPRYYMSMIGAPLGVILKGQIKSDRKARVISGNVLTGHTASVGENLHYYDTMVSVIPEGDKFEFMGWASPGFGKFSATRLFPSCLMRGKRYDLDTNLHGGERAFVMSGQYEKVFPMRIYPVQLVKAIMADDIEGMEDLGIYEVSEEDFALCDFVCTSKIEAQSIVRHGLNRMIEETN